MVSQSKKIVLTKHRLQYLPELRVDSSFFDKVFQAGCSMANCNATCCRDGVWLDPAERDKILANAELIKRYMDPHQDHNEQQWFDAEEVIDPDFPSGKAVGTQTRSYGCVFLKGNGHCVLQNVAVGEGKSKFSLKPYFCFAFPVAIDSGELLLDDPDFTNRAECCSFVQHGEHSVIDLCAEELEFMLGKEGFEELKNVHATLENSRD